MDTINVFNFSLQVREILWNIESTVMAVWLEDLKMGEDKTAPHSYGKVQWET